ncbi:MAG: hypothetical protein AAGA50_14240 [Pseudomonadota bacterium]
MTQLRRMAVLFLIVLALSGCIVSQQPLITSKDADWPFSVGTIWEEYKVENTEFEPKIDKETGANVTAHLDSASDFYVLKTGKDASSALTFRLKQIGSSNSYIAMVPPAENSKQRKLVPIDYMYSLVRRDDSYVVVYNFQKDDFENYNKYMQLNQPDRWKQLARSQWQLVHREIDVQVRSLYFLEEILPHMVDLGYFTQGAAYRPSDPSNAFADSGPSASKSPPTDNRRQTEKNDKITSKVVRLVLASPWAKREQTQNDSYKSLRVEFYSKAIFGFTVSLDRSKCYFHFWRRDRTDKMLNRAFDRDCDGRIDAIKTFAKGAKWESRNPTRYEQAFYDYYLPRYSAVFEAVNDFKSYLPKAKLALLPDLRAIDENKRILQDIATAASASDLMGEATSKSNYILKIWVNEGADEGGFEVAFTADKGMGSRLKDCFISIKDKTGPERLIDRNCDAIPEVGEYEHGVRKMSAAGNEQVVRSMFLEVGRFAAVANKFFKSGEAEALAKRLAQKQ